MGSVLFYGSAIFFCLGIFVSSLWNVPRDGIILLLLVSFIYGVLWRRKGFTFSSPLFITSLFILCFTVGLFRIEVTTWQESVFSLRAGQHSIFEGVVIREPDVRQNNQHLYIRETKSGEMLLVTTDPFLHIEYGDRLVVEGETVAPESFQTDLGRTFNYPGYLRARGVEYMMPFAEVVVIAENEGNVIIASLLTFKHALMDQIERAIPEPSAGLAEGLLLGVKRALGDDLEEVFRSVGIIHIVVLSGYNVMIVVEAIMRLLSFFFLPRTRLLLGIAAITAFALLVGLSATVVRASIMAGLVLIARATGRITSVTRSLIFAGAVMVLINPYLLVFDPGFQLSFLATLGLIFLAPKLEEWLRFAPTTFQIREFITATIATQIMVLPLLLFLIGEFSVVAVLANVLVLPVVPLAMGLSFATATMGFVLPPLALLFGFVAHLSLAYIVHVAELLALLPFASFMVPAFPFWITALLYGVLAYFVTRVHTKEVFESEEEDARETGFSSLNTEYRDWTIVSLESVKAKLKPPAESRSDSSGGFPFR